MIELHAITVRGRMLVAQVVNGKLVIPAKAGTTPAAGPVQPAPGK